MRRRQAGGGQWSLWRRPAASQAPLPGGGQWASGRGPRPAVAGGQRRSGAAQLAVGVSVGLWEGGNWAGRWGPGAWPPGPGAWALGGASGWQPALAGGQMNLLEIHSQFGSFRALKACVALQWAFITFKPLPSPWERMAALPPLGPDGPDPPRGRWDDQWDCGIPLPRSYTRPALRASAGAARTLRFRPQRTLARRDSWSSKGASSANGRSSSTSTAS